MPSQSTHPLVPRWTAALAFAAAALTLVLIGVGGMVTNTDSGLACPDWPTCFGTPFPKLVGGVLMEHGHRYIGTAVGFLSALLVLVVLRAHGQGRLAALSLAVSMPLVLGASTWAALVKHKTGALPLLPSLLCLAGTAAGLVALARARGAGRLAQGGLLLVMTQGLFGGLTVVYKLPVTVLVLHLGTSMIVLALLLWLGFALRAEAGAGDARAALPAGTWRLLAATAALTWAQIVLGAAVRHTGAGLVCTDIPLCRGALWPLGVHPAVHLHMAHRALGLVVAGLVIALAVRVWTARDLLVRNLARALPLLVAAQVGLGFLTIWTFKELATVTLHLVVATLLWGACVALLARARATAPSPAAEAPALAEPAWKRTA